MSRRAKPSGPRTTCRYIRQNLIRSPDKARNPKSSIPRRRQSSVGNHVRCRLREKLRLVQHSRVRSRKDFLSLHQALYLPMEIPVSSCEKTKASRPFPIRLRLEDVFRPIWHKPKLPESSHAKPVRPLFQSHDA